jgi:uncharacterized protein (DUF58 family)
LQTKLPQPGQPVARRYHVHGALVLYCLVALLLSIGAFNSNNNLLFWLFSLSLSMLIVSGFISGAMLMGVRIEREAVPDGAVGSAAVVRYRVTNINRWVPIFGITIVESPGPAPADETGTARGRLEKLPVAFAAYVPARQSVVVEAPVLITGRGRVRLDDIVVTSEFPFGIVLKSLRFHQPAALLARPRKGESALDSDREHKGSAGLEPAATRVGSGGDHFFALREYHPGDSPRLISWRASARRTGGGGNGAGTDLLVRQTTALQPRRLFVLLDLRGAPGADDYEDAISRAAGTIEAGADRAIQLGLMVVLPGQTEPRTLAEPRSGRWHTARMLNDLAMLPAFDDAAAGSAGAGSPSSPVHAPPAQAIVIRAHAREITGAVGGGGRGGTRS